MRQDQQRYSMERVTSALNEKMAVLKEKHTKPTPSPTDKQKFDAIQRGDVGVKRSGWNIKTPIGECFNFIGITKESALDRDAYNKEARKLSAEAAKIKDEIMLGDATKAQKLILAFCQK